MKAEKMGVVDLEWHSEKRKIKDLIPWKRNPRRITEVRMAKLQKSLSKFGYASPVIVNLDGQIIAGHMRLKAMILLKMVDKTTEVEARVPNRQLTKKEAEELAVVDNVSYGEWDTDLLSADFDIPSLESIGFEPLKFGIPFSIPRKAAENRSGGENDDEETAQDEQGEGQDDDSDESEVEGQGASGNRSEKPNDADAKQEDGLTLTVLCESPEDINKVTAVCRAYQIKFRRG